MKKILIILAVIGLILSMPITAMAKKPVEEPIWDNIPIYSEYPIQLPIVRAHPPGKNK